MSSSSLSKTKSFVLLSILVGILGLQQFTTTSYWNVYLDSTPQTTKNAAASQSKTSQNSVLRIWRRYQQEHSDAALWKEFHNATTTVTGTRKFAIGYYSCPLQAGNRLHHFFNAMIWAVITNRTLLWKYYDEESCRRVGIHSGARICDAANTVQDCDTVLTRAAWIPSLDVWNTQWTPLIRDNATSLISFRSTHGNSSWSPQHAFDFDDHAAFVGPPDTDPSLLVDFAPMLGQDAGILKDKVKRQELLHSPETQRLAKDLFQLGRDYVYGLVFDDCFAIRPSITTTAPQVMSGETATRGGDNRTNTSSLASNSSVANNNNNNELLIVLHSRHSRVDDDGTKIAREQHCLDRILNERQHNETFPLLCKVILLSGRAASISMIADYMITTFPGCITVVASHDLGWSFRSEHGPFSGVGFYQDLLLVQTEARRASRTSSSSSLSNATTRAVFIGSKKRSSSQLIRETLTYNRVRRDSGGELTIQDTALETCYLEEVQKLEA